MALSLQPMTELLQKIETKLDKNITIYMVSSSIDPKDYEKAKSFSSVTDYLIKPIEISKVEEIFASQKSSA